METLIKLTVRTPNQRFEDLQVDCDIRWTVRKLKEHLQDVYPSKPATRSQRLIYCGKLLQDHVSLGEVFGQIMNGDDEGIVRTLHIVCAECHESSVSLQNIASGQQQSAAHVSQTPDEGLRRRRVNTQTIQPTTEPTAPSTSSHQHQQSAATSTTSPPLSPPSIMHQFSQSSPMMPQFSQPAFYQQLSPTTAGFSGGAFLFPSPQSTSMPSQQQATYHLQMQAAYMQHWQHAQRAGTSPMAAHAEWLRYYQQHFAAPQPLTPPPTPQITSSPPSHVQALPQNLPPPPAAPAAAQNNQNVRINAGPGGAMGLADDEDEDEGVMRDRDWVDYVYLMLRAMLTLGIVFFYSTTTRFALVCLLGFIVYLYQAGYLTPRRAPVHAPVAEQPAAAVDNPPADGGQENAVAEGEQNAHQVNTPPPAVEPNRPSTVRVLCTFVVSFFTSLVPQGVPPVQAN